MNRLICLIMLIFLASPSYSAEPVKIGLSLSSSGKHAEIGTMLVRAYKLWEAHVNKKGGLLGRPVQLIIYDDKSDSTIAKELYQRLIVEDKVDFVFGPYSSEITGAVAPIAEKYKYPMLAATAAADSLYEKGYKHLFGVLIPTSKLTAGFLELIVANGIDSIAIISAEDTFSKAVAKGTKDWIKRFGLNLIFSEEINGTQDLEQSIIRAKASGAQVLMICGLAQESMVAHGVLKIIGWHPKAFYATVGPAAVKYYETYGSDNHTFSSSQWEPTVLFPGSKEFSDTFEKTYQIKPTYHAAAAYATGQILETVVKNTNTIHRDNIRDALSLLDTLTIIGRYGVDQTGKQIRHFVVEVQWQKGKKETIAPKELKTASPIWN